MSIKIEGPATMYVWSGPQKFLSPKDADKRELTLAKIRGNLQDLKEDLMDEASQ